MAFNKKNFIHKFAFKKCIYNEEICINHYLFPDSMGIGDRNMLSYRQMQRIARFFRPVV